MKYLAVIGILLCVIVGGLIVLLTFGNDYDSIDVDTDIKGNVCDYGETIPIKAVEKSSRVYGIKQIMQLPELPTGCEVTALTMVLNFFGHDADKLEIAQDYLEKEKLYLNDDEILCGPDFRYVFPGDPEEDSSFGCLAPCIEQTAQKYLDAVDSAYSVKDITGTSFYDLFDYISDEMPVIIWSTMSLKEPEYITSWLTAEGEKVTWPTNEHCVVLSAYDYTNNTVILNDPTFGVVSMNMEKVKKRYDQLGKNAVIIFKE